MHQAILVLFAIPVISIVGIGIYQIADEMKKKKFILERRAAVTAEQAAGTPRRRYSDSVPPGTLRNPDTASSGTATEVTAPQVHGV